MPTTVPEKILHRIDWQVVRRLDGILQGNYRTLFIGQGLDLADVREYQIGDDVRTIDWNVTARLNTPHVRQYLEDREITAWFLVDLSPSVDFGTMQTKRELTIDCVTTLARLFTRHGNRAGAILYDSEVRRVIPPGSTRLHLLALIHELVNLPPLPRSPLTNVAGLLETAGRSIRRRSMIFLISDFMTRPGWDEPLRLLSHRHDVLAVHISDPCEHDLPDLGLVLVEDAETGEQLYLDTADRKFRQRYRAAADQLSQQVDQGCRQARVDVLRLETGGDMVRDIVRFATLRKKRRRR